MSRVGVALGLGSRRTLPRLALLICGSAFLIAAKQSASITDQAAFEAAVAAVKADAHNYDKFKEPVATDLIGKPFAITMPVQEGSEGQGIAYYDYDGGTLVLNVSPQNAWPLLAGPKEALPTLIISDSTKTTGTYIGQNAFGVTAKVTNFQNSSSGIAIVSAPKRMLSPMRTRMNATVLDDTDWWIAKDLPPKEAKALALNVVAIVQGTYARLPSGNVGFCSSAGLSATLDRPSNYGSEKCFIGARISRIALAQKDTGKVLHEWTTVSDPTLGPVLWGGIRAGMTKQELKSVQPSITDYGYVESNGQTASVEMSKGVASKVRVHFAGLSGRPLMEVLNGLYGKPLAGKCITNNLCEGRWRANTQVDVYLSITGDVTYQLRDDKPPVGFSP